MSDAFGDAEKLFQRKVHKARRNQRAQKGGLYNNEADESPLGSASSRKWAESRGINEQRRITISFVEGRLSNSSEGKKYGGFGIDVKEKTRGIQREKKEEERLRMEKRMERKGREKEVCVGEAERIAWAKGKTGRARAKSSSKKK